MRLYQFPRAAGAPMMFPVGVGSEGWTTPVGTFSVIQKQVNPRWYPPASIRREEPDLPAMVPPGPDNPLGTHALRLSKGSILIHGTDKPFGVGRKASHGCLRLYPEDIPLLFERVPVGTQVTIVREPVKVGVRAGRVYVEVHARRRLQDRHPRRGEAAAHQAGASRLRRRAEARRRDEGRPGAPGGRLDRPELKAARGVTASRRDPPRDRALTSRPCICRSSKALAAFAAAVSARTAAASASAAAFCAAAL